MTLTIFYISVGFVLRTRSTTEGRKKGGGEWGTDVRGVRDVETGEGKDVEKDDGREVVQRAGDRSGSKVDYGPWGDRRTNGDPVERGLDGERSGTRYHTRLPKKIVS